MLTEFDPAKMNMAQLRKVLSEHDIDYTKAKKKADLVALFSEKIGSKSAELLKKNENVASYAGDIEPATVKRSARKSVSVLLLNSLNFC